MTDLYTLLTTPHPTLPFTTGADQDQLSSEFSDSGMACDCGMTALRLNSNSYHFETGNVGNAQPRLTARAVYLQS